MQTGMAEGNGGLAEAKRLQFRMGINLGDIIIDGDDIYGDGVNVAARVEALAAPGGIALSGYAHDQVAGKVDVSFEDAGEHELKNIARPVRIYQVVMDGAPSTSSMPSSPAFVSSLLPDKLSVAVLPFDDMSSDPEQAYFCDGMTEDLITELAHVQGLTVIARHSSFAYKGRSVDARQIGSELGVRHLVEGSVRRAGDRVRITAQLIDADSGSHLWAQRYDRDIDDIFAVQDDVVRQIATALSDALGRPALHPPNSVHPRNFDAYEYVMRGRQNVLSAQGHAEAKQFLETAIELDPGLSDAHAWLAVTTTRTGFFISKNRAARLWRPGLPQRTTRSRRIPTIRSPIWRSGWSAFMRDAERSRCNPCAARLN